MKDLEKTIIEKRAELKKFRFDLSGSGVKNVKVARNARKEIARAFTKLRTSDK